MQTILFHHTPNCHSEVRTEYGTFRVFYIRSFSSAPHIIISLTCDGVDARGEFTADFWI